MEALVTGAADAAVRLSALAAATAAAPAAAQVTARRRRCLAMFMYLPCFSGGATAARPVSGRSTQHRAHRVQSFFWFFFEPAGPAAAYLLPDGRPDGATRCGQRCDLAQP